MHLVRWEELLDEARSDELAQGRARERWMRRQATERATFVGTLLDLAEAGVGVTVWVVGGRRHDGAPVGLGHDVVVLVERGDHVVVQLTAVTLVRPQPGSGVPAASGDRAAALDLRFVELLARLVDGHPDVAVALVSGEVLAGSLVAVGDDVVSVRLAPGADGLAYCPASAVSSVRFRSG